jgi:nitrogen fixation NifU-like protein
VVCLSLEELYKEVILDHYRTPRNKGQLDPHDVALERNNPLCGDELE